MARRTNRAADGKTEGGISREERQALLAQARGRMALAAGIFMIGYLAVVLRLVDLTLLQGRPEIEVAAEEERAVEPLAAPLRADIVDRNGMLLATSLKVASVYADATLVEDAGKLADALARILPGQDRKELLKKLSSGKKFVWIQRDVTPRQQYDINALGNPALNFRAEDKRIYPAGSLAVHVTGYADIDGVGIAGIERAFDRELRKGGAPVELALDLRVQHILRRELAAARRKFSAKAAAGVVMDAETGEVIAAVSLPDFDPHHAGEAAAEARFNRVSLGVFEMGSTFKIFSTAAALDSGAVKMSSVFNAEDPIRYGRFTINDYHAKKRALTLPEVFIHSSNIGTARMAMEAGTEKIREFYSRLGFFSPAPGELPERGSPLYPRQWGEVSTMTTSYGHGIAVTPLHVARAAAAMVNGGLLPEATFVKRKQAAAPGARVASEKTSEAVRRLMALNVAAGTGALAAAEGYHVGGKTGTAEKNVKGRYVKDRVMPSFVGVFPSHAPRYVVLAMLDEPQPIAETRGYVTGGWTAAPVVGRVVADMAPLYGMPPDNGAKARAAQEAVKAMAVYIRDEKERKSLAALGAD